MKTNWIMKNRPDKERVDEISKKLNVPTIIVDILINRGFDSEDEIKGLLYPKIEDMYDPFLMKDMEKAVIRINQAIERKEKIMIFGDYDVDGITSTALIYNFLVENGLSPDYFIPNRVDDGYGFSKKGINLAIERNIDVIITVDCGITGLKEVDYANKHSIDVIITDHHEVMENIPSAVAILNPNRFDDKYPFKYLAGVGVVLKLIQGFLKYKNKDFLDIKKYIDLVALGTVADVVPLIDENRIITYFGIEAIKVTNNQGLKALCDVSGISKEKLTSFHIGFALAPRINAAGRMSDANEAVRLFISEDECESNIIAHNLNEENIKRKKIDQEVFDETIEIIEKKELYKKNTIILAGENWHEGVIGIVASRLVEKYYKPVIMLSLTDNMGKGSGRSIPDFHMYNALIKTSNLLESFGGHKLAAGITIKRENIEKFISEFEKIAENSLLEDEKIRSIEIDAEIPLNEINDNLEKKLRLLAPFGYGNPMPLLVTKDVNILGYPIIFKNKHLRFTTGYGNHTLDCIWFNAVKKLSSAIIDDKNIVNLAFYIKRNNFQGKDEIQLQIKDIKIGDI